MGKLIASFIALIVLFSSTALPACRKSEEQISETTVEEVEKIEEETETFTEEEITEEEAEEEVPQDIQDLIDGADSYYGDGEYAEASKAYRDAVLAVEGSDLSEEKKDELLGYLNSRYEETKEIVDTARMHHGNAMQLQYEKRFEEAKQELEMALEIYPKYQPAIDALETLQAMEDLN